MNTNKGGWIIGLLTASFLTQGCSPPPPTRIAFNDRMAKEVKNLLNLGMAFRKPLAILMEKGEALPSDASSTMATKAAEIKQVVAAYVTSADAMALPRTPTPSAEPFKKAYQDFLVTQSKIANECLDQVVAVTRSGKPPAAMRDEIRAIMANRVEKLEAPARQALFAAQNQFAGECKLRLGFRRY